MSLCLLATVVGVHGLRGWLKVIVHSDIENRLSYQETVLVGKRESRTKTYGIEDTRENPGQSFVKLESVDDRTTAEMLVGANFYITDEQMLPPPDGRHFVHDIIGCEVIEEATGKSHGNVLDVMLLPANDAYVVVENGREVLIPAIPDVVKHVDIAAKRITIDPIPGLFTEDEDED